ncbi:MAG: tyrosine--tRNA ligase [Candidatus Acetothermia bacterium]|jgi:tyrosyl-tRNA synthetase|nr:tyrosine--tRNA ligase [Candidatus Acetothermia bacterium]MDH7504862.1 tyrosine--tRNA ligase [Candidatus Acetothermia bacterium]
MDARTQLELLKRGVAVLLPEEALLRKLERSLERGEPLRVKLGIDPSAPQLTLGHAVVLRKLRQFQRLGHTAVLIVGDFTRLIGDPSGRTSTRPPMSKAEIERNMASYAEQAYKILDPKMTEIHYNSEWLGKLSFEDVVRLSARYTVARMLERDDFSLRFKRGLPITIMEFLYPLAQAYDSVAVAADVEIGGEDQQFNFLIGRAIQEAFGQEPQVILTMPLLIGTDGEMAMGQSKGNYIGVAEPPQEMFGKIMALPDHLMPQYFALLTDLSQEELAKLEEAHPRDRKMRLAREIVTQFHSPEAAAEAEEEFVRVFQRQELPSNLPTVAVTGEPISPLDLLSATGLVKSRGEARRLIDQGGVELDGERLTGLEPVTVRDGAILQVGKRRFVRLVLQKG